MERESRQSRSFSACARHILSFLQCQCDNNDIYKCIAISGTTRSTLKHVSVDLDRP
jgi:hypothetical protein